MQSYCNTVPTTEGGTHEAGLRAALMRGHKAYGEMTGEKRAGLITAEDVIGNAGALISVFIRNPEFQGQTKEKLSSSEAQRLVETVLRDPFDHWLTAAPKTADRLLQFIIERAEDRLKRRRDKDVARASATRKLRLPGKLADCSGQATDGTELFIVEGDSAGGSAKQARNRQTQAILPLRGNRASLVWTESTDRAEALRQARPEMFEAHLRRRFGDYLGEIEVLGPRFVYPLSLQLAETMAAPRLALMGDAAHGVHPIAGQGLNLGLKDAAALAEVLTDALRLGEDIGSPVVLERYAAWRRFDNVMLAAATDLFVRLFSNDNPLIRLARGAGMAVVNLIGPARKFFMQEAGGAVGDLPKLLRGERL
jgi:hypothetical protein